MGGKIRPSGGGRQQAGRAIEQNRIRLYEAKITIYTVKGALIEEKAVTLHPIGPRPARCPLMGYVRKEQ